jgi:5'-3' exonuclease
MEGSFINIASYGYKDDATIICLDIGSSTARKNLYPEYKANRLTSVTPHILEFKQKTKPITIQKLRDHAKKRGWMILGLDGYEADDIMAWLCRKPYINDEKFLITQDMDLYQLLDNKTAFVNDALGTIQSYNMSNFTETTINKSKRPFGMINPKDIITMKSLGGDKSDNIMGCRKLDAKGQIAKNRIGDVTAYKLVYKYETIQNMINRKIRNDIKITGEEAILNYLNSPNSLMLQDYELNKKIVDIDYIINSEYFQRVMLEQYNQQVELLS